jgi:D-xylose transport system substrate-binding protein
MDDYLPERWLKDKELFIKRANEKEAKVFVEVANNNPEKQFNQAKKLLDEGIDVLVIVPVDLNDAASIIVAFYDGKQRDYWTNSCCRRVFKGK